MGAIRNRASREGQERSVAGSWGHSGEGIREEATTAAIKRVAAWQLAEEMKKQGITKKRLAELMRTSRAQIDRSMVPIKI
jgi:hypothetical protein